jgi:integrase
MARKIIKLRARRESDSRFVVAIPQVVTHTKRVRRVFSNQHEADVYIDNVADCGYVQAETIRSNGGEIEKSTGPLREWLRKYLAELKSVGSLTSWRSKCHTLGRLEQRLGNRSINTITRDDMLGWIQVIKGAPYTRKNHQRHASAFFEWCLDLDEPPIIRSPIRKKDRIRIKRKPPTLLLPDQFAACLEWAKKNNELELLAHLCLGGFHGIRTEEIIRMNWQDLDWKNNMVHILLPKDVDGARPRHPKMKDGLHKHLQPFALVHGPIIPIAIGAEDRSNAIHLWLGRHRRPMLKAVGLSGWPRNTLRHSFKSYHEALYEDYSHTQREMGHTNTAMTRYGYGADTAGGFWVTEEMAQRWFAV